MAEPFEGTDIDPSRILFIGQGNSPVCYYRCMLPAHSIGCDYVGIFGEPGNLQYATGLTRHGAGPVSQLPDYDNYDVVIVQQVRGERWLEFIDEMQARGKRVIYEIDDHLWSVGSLTDHDWSHAYTEHLIQGIEMCMGQCDLILTSTTYLATEINMRLPASKVMVARNGIDPARYAYTKVPHPTAVTIGWAGATGHRDSAGPWIDQVVKVMGDHPEAAFMSIGEPLAREVVRRTSPERGLALPWMAIEQYPAALTMIDIALAPGGGSDFQRSKSDLRWLEASLAGAVTIANPNIYSEIRDGYTGFFAHSPEEAGAHMAHLLEDKAHREITARSARDYVLSYRTMEDMRPGWERAIAAAVE